MSDSEKDFNASLRQALSAEDEAFLQESLSEKNYYREVLSNLKGQGSVMNILAWGGVFAFSAGLIFSLWQLFIVDTVREQIIYATFAVLCNMAQIALKLWFNMRMNRRAVMMEIQRLRLQIAK